MSRHGKIHFIKTNLTKEEKVIFYMIIQFGVFYQINSSIDNMINIHISPTRVLGVTSN